MGKTLELPSVADCAVRECAYNMTGSCRARAITIGDGIHPACDTFLRTASEHSDEPDASAGVGACKISGCRHNRSLECSAPSIRVGYHSDHPDCLTFAAR
jgi:hypothetical protein